MHFILLICLLLVYFIDPENGPSTVEGKSFFFYNTFFFFLKKETLKLN